MDLAIEGMGFSTKDTEKTADERWSMVEIGEKLRAQVPGIAVIDNDFSLKTKEYELGMGGKEPGRMPEESIKLLEDLKASGWQILVVSNQPKEGHQVARVVKKLKNGEYPIFPDSVEEVLGDDGVDGGGKDFLWHKYKDSSASVAKTAKWITERTDKVLGQVYFVGDRDGDVNFGLRVGKELKDSGVNRQINIWKVRGLELPKVMKPLEKLIP